MFNLLAQLFGSKKGHELNVAISKGTKLVLTEGEAVVLNKVGIEPTLHGAIQYLEVKVDAAIEAETILNETEKLILVSLINGLASHFDKVE